MSVKFSNNAVTTLSAGISAGATSFTVASATLFPTLSGSDWTYVSLTSEVVKVTAISGTTFTCDATSDAHTSGESVELRMTAELLNDFAEDTEALPLAGGTMTGNVSLGDNVKAKFGAGNDLQIYHDSSNSYIDDVGAGNLRIRGTNNVYLQVSSDGGSTWENAVICDADAAVTLRHNNFNKLVTTSNGIDVTGDSSEGSDTPPTIAILDSSNGTWNAAHDSFGNLDFENLDTSGAGSGGVKARISAQVTSTDGAASELGFYHGSGTTLTQGMLLDSTGIDVTGNVAVSGTVDGRDVATDGDELDGILAGSIGRINSPLLDLPLTNSLSMRSGVGSVTFARTTTATYVDRYGVLQTAPIDEPRFEKEGLLVEGTSTNLVPNQTMSASVGAPTVNLNSVTSPDGTTNATEIVNVAGGTASSLAIIPFSVTGAIGDVYTASIFCKAGVNTSGAGAGGDVITFNPYFVGDSEYNSTFVFSTESHSGPTFTHTKLANGWYRLSIVMTATVAFTALYFRVWECGRGAARNIGDSNYVFGYQAEDLPFATSYIPTTSSAVTRGQDVATVSYDNNMMSATQELTVVADMNVPSYNVSYSLGRGWFGIVGESYRYLRTQANSTTGTIEGTGLLASFTISKALNNYCFTSNSTGIISYVDGASVSTGSALTVQRTGATSISLGETGHSSSTKLFGHIKNFKTYDITLTANEIKLLQGA